MPSTDAATDPDLVPTPGDAARAPLTRDTVVAGARALIESEGLEALSLRRIGAALGVTAPALYAYVTDKRDLLRAVAETAFADLLARFDAVDDPDPLTRMRALSRVYIGYAVDHPELFRTMFLFPPDLALGEATGEELPIATRAFNYASDTIREAQAAGVVRDDLDPLAITFSSWTATHGMAAVLNLGFAFDEATRGVLVDGLLDVVIRGLRP